MNAKPPAPKPTNFTLRTAIPVTPDALKLKQALQRSEPLMRLAALMRDSDARFAAVRSCLPAMLVPHVKAGPVDEAGWSLLAANAAVAAKLRQLQPRLEAVLRDQGWSSHAIRIKVQ